MEDFKRGSHTVWDSKFPPGVEDKDRRSG